MVKLSHRYSMPSIKRPALQLVLQISNHSGSLRQRLQTFQPGVEVYTACIHVVQVAKEVECPKLLRATAEIYLEELSATNPKNKIPLSDTLRFADAYCLDMPDIRARLYYDVMLSGPDVWDHDTDITVEQKRTLGLGCAKCAMAWDNFIRTYQYARTWPTFFANLLAQTTASALTSQNAERDQSSAPSTSCSKELAASEYGFIGRVTAFTSDISSHDVLGKLGMARHLSRPASVSVGDKANHNSKSEAECHDFAIEIIQKHLEINKAKLPEYFHF